MKTVPHEMSNAYGGVHAYHSWELINDVLELCQAKRIENG